MNLHLEEITIKNWRSIVALKVNENQQNFIESNAYSRVTFNKILLIFIYF